MRRFPPRRPATTLALVALMAGLVVGTSSTPPTSVEATSIVPFGVAFTDNDNGSIATFGNNLMVCPATVADCAATRAGTTTKNNNNYNMVHLDDDGAAFPTFSSSSAAVTLPDGAEVRWAGLYWGARLGAGRGGVAAPAPATGREMKLRAPGDAAYRTITAGRLFGPSTTPDRAYQAFADVTSIVQAAGPGAYFGADVPAATGEDRHAGWSLVVVYRSSALPLRNLTVFDGLADVGQGDPQSITISGFTTPVTGVVNARIGLVAYEGDRGSTGDRAIFNGTQLATTLSPGTNFFNGTNDDNGTLVTARTPSDVNMLGFDIKNFDAPGILGNGATSARIDLASTSERYFPGVVTTAIDVFAPDFSPSTKIVTNLSGGDPARVGDTLRYSVTFVNAGQDPAINWSITDPIPTGTSYVPGSLTVVEGTGTGSFEAGPNQARIAPTPAADRFEIGETLTFTFDVDVGAAAADTQVTNRATITYDGATVAELQDLEFSTGAAAIAVVPSADLVVTKVNSPSPVVAGEPLTSTITVRNGGPSPATDVEVTDELPAGLGTVTATPSVGSCSVAAQLVTCQLGTLAPGAIVTITVVAPVPPGSTAATLTDIARVTSPTADPDPGDNTAGATTDVTRDADLSVSKTATPATVTPGGVITYTITATSGGPPPPPGGAIDDALPDPAVEILSASSDPAGTCATDPNSARCTVDSLAPGASVVMTVNAVAVPGATPGSIVDNVASVSSATPDSDPSDNSVTAQVTIGPAESDLDVVKTADAPAPLIAGLGEVRYTIDVSNGGPSNADPVSVSDVLPAGFVVVSATSDRGTCAVAPGPTGDTVTCDVGRLLAPFAGAGGAQARITIVAEVPSGVAPGTYPNAATASAPSSPTPTTSPPAPVTVAALANVSIIKSFPEGTTDPDITPGEPKTYRIRVVNDGPSVATDVTVTDTLPTGLTVTAWRVGSVTPPGPTPGCDVATATCDLGDLPVGTTVELELDVVVDPALVIDPDVGVANTAQVSSPTDDPNLGDNTSTFTASGGAQADLSIRKTPPEVSPVAGVPETDTGSLASRSYRLEIANFGPSTATGLTFTDTLPPGVTFEKLYDFDNPDFDLTPLLGCTVTGDPQVGQTVSCTFPFDLPAFVGVFFGLEFTVDPTLPNGTVLENEASIDSAVEDNNPGNNSSTALVPVRAVANLRTIKRVFEIDPVTLAAVREVPEDEVLALPAGYPLQFQLDVVNDGPSAASDVQVVDRFEALAAVGLQGVNCEILSLELVCPYVNPATGDLLLPYDGTAATLFAVPLLVVPLANTAEDTYTNSVTAASTTEDPDLDNNTDTRDVEISEPIADLAIEKSALTSPLVAGETFTYEIDVTAGLLDFTVSPPVLRWSSDAQDVVVTDTLPPGLVPSSATATQGSCAVTDQDVRCELGTVSALTGPEPITPATVTITGTVEPGVVGDDVENTAEATSSTGILGGVDSVSSTATTPLTRSADLAVTKAADSTFATAGGGITFTVTVTNTGPSDATNVELTDLLPVPLEFSSDGSDDECTLEGGDVVCDLGTIAAGESRALTIGARLPSDEDAVPVTNVASVTSDVDDPDDTNDSASVDVDVVQSADLSITKTPGAEGVLLGETIAYTLTVVNEGPSDATDVVLAESIPTGTTVETLPPGCTGAGPVTCTLGDLVAGRTLSLEIVLRVPDTLPPGPLPNTATVTSDIDDADQSDNSASATVEAIAQADVILTKELVTPNPVAGQPVEYQLTLFNKGPTVAPNASLSDPIPTGTTFLAFEPSQGTCQLDEVEDVPAASCNLGRMAVGATATATLTVLTDPNTTRISNTGFSGSGGLDEIPADNEATAATTLGRVADLSVTKTGPSTVSSASPATYVIEYRNDGPSTVFDAVVTDTLSAGLIPRPVDGCTIAATTVTCPIAALAPGGTGSISITADVDPAQALGAVLTDVASIASSALDPDLADNTAEVSSTVEAQNDVGVTVTAVQDEVRPGELASYNVVVTNNGPQLASAVTVTNELPPELIDRPAPAGAAGSSFGVIAALAPAGCIASGSTAVCALGDLAVGESRTLLFEGTVETGTAAGTQLVHTATVVFDGTDSVEANNRDADTILVIVALQQPPTTTTPRLRCDDLTFAEAQRELAAGATYLDGDDDGIACEVNAGGGGGAGRLPVTGVTIGVLLAFAATAVVIGGGLRAGVRRHRR